MNIGEQLGGLVTGYLRRRLSTVIMKANEKCFLERLVLVGEDQGQQGGGDSGKGGKRRGQGGTVKANGWSG